MMSDLKGKALKSKVNPCAKCGKRVMENSVMLTKYGKWVQSRCAKMKGVFLTLENNFVGSGCDETIK